MRSLEERLVKFLAVEFNPNGHGSMCVVLRHKNLAVKLATDANGRGKPCRFPQTKETAVKILAGIIRELGVEHEEDNTDDHRQSSQDLVRRGLGVVGEPEDLVPSGSAAQSRDHDQ